MLSVHIICAVHVLQELDKARCNTKKPDRGLFPDDFHLDDDFRRPILRRVLRTLLRLGYVEVSTKKKYTVHIDVGEITLMDLVRIFHGEVCIGESFDHYLSVGPEYLKTREYQHLLKFESLLQGELTRRLEGIRLRDLRDGLPTRRIVEPAHDLAAAVNQ